MGTTRSSVDLKIETRLEKKTPKSRDQDFHLGYQRREPEWRKRYLHIAEFECFAALLTQGRVKLEDLSQGSRHVSDAFLCSSLDNVI